MYNDNDDTRDDIFSDDRFDSEAMNDDTLEGESFDDDSDGGDDREPSVGIEFLPSAGVLSFYDGLRQRIVDFLDERGGSLGQTASDYLLLVPDIFILLSRLALDKEVPRDQRALIGSAMAYFVMPIDLIPEVFVGPVGYLDDLVLAAAVLSRVFGDDLEHFTDRHWSGSGKLRTVLSDLSQTAESLVGKNVYGKIKTLLRKKGLDVDAG